MAGAFTSVPRAMAPSDEPVAPALLIVSFTAAGEDAAAQAWPRRNAPSLEHFHRASAGAADLVDLAERLAEAHVGLRVLVAGPEADVFAASAVLEAAGMVREEVTQVIVDGGARRVFCTHCTAVIDTHERVGGVVRCSGCGRDLLIYHHFSRRTASYMGFQVDAEEAP